MNKVCVSLFVLLLIAQISYAQTANENFEKAKISIQKENYTEAIRLLKLANVAEPENIDIKIALADALYLKRAYYDAMPLHFCFNINLM